VYKFKMFILLVLVALVVGCTIQTGSVTGSGNVVTREVDVSGFDRLEIGNAFNVDIRQGETFSVVVRVDDNLLDYLIVKKSGSTLKLGLKTGLTVGLQNTTQEARVTMPELTGLALSGAVLGTISGFQSTNRFDLDVSGASHLRGDIEAGDARFNVTGASGVTLRGSAGDLSVTARGASTVDLADFAVADAIVKAVGASHVTVKPDGTLDADATGASNVYLAGDPRSGSWDAAGASSVGR
jgi:hypothetical protein